MMYQIHTLMMNMFSTFDPMWFNLCYKNLMLMMYIIFSMMSMFWHKQSKTMLLVMSPTMFMNSQLKTTKMKTMKNMYLLTSTMFLLLIYTNSSSMVPYSFSTSSHIIFTMSLSLPMWMSMVMSSTNYSTKTTIAHLLPDSAPLWLSPFLTLIETTSIIVRPMTLSFRLAANMTAGHIILALMLTFSTTSKKTLILSISLACMYTSFELMICAIQAYILCLLLSLYSNDHA